MGVTHRLSVQVNAACVAFVAAFLDTTERMVTPV